MTIISDAFVFFGATGDLAHKKIFPALQSMIQHGALTVPIIGVAKSGWTLEQLKERARDGITKFGGGVDEAAFQKLCALLKYIDGDYNDDNTYKQLRIELNGRAPTHYWYLLRCFRSVRLGSGCFLDAQCDRKPFGRDLVKRKLTTPHLHFPKTTFSVISITPGRGGGREFMAFRRQQLP
jgi:glucose-6-phosphate 1-dehydrogenase